MRRDRPSEENFTLVLSVNHRSEVITHTPLRDHASRHVGRALEVIGRPGGHLAHENLFRDTPTKQD